MKTPYILRFLVRSGAAVGAAVGCRNVNPTAQRSVSVSVALPQQKSWDFRHFGRFRGLKSRATEKTRRHGSNQSTAVVQLRSLYWPFRVASSLDRGCGKF